METMKQRKRSAGFTKSIVIVLFVLCIVATVKPAAVHAAADDWGWRVSKASYSFLTSGEKKIFDKAVNGMTGVSYRPVALLATQVVAGTNYVFLCQGTTVTIKPVNRWYVLTVYENLAKKVSLLSIKEIRLTDIKTEKEPKTGPLAGGLQITAVKNKPAALAETVRKVFQTAVKTYTGYKLKPVALLGKQAAAGTNYRILCFGKKHALANLFILDINQNAKGECTVTSCKPLMLEEYVGR